MTGEPRSSDDSPAPRKRRRRSEVRAERSPERTSKYLARVLAANPLDRAEEIVQARSRFLGLERRETRSAAPDPGDVRESRNFVAEQIDDLRSRFWQLNVSHLKASVDQLELDPFPDLARAAQRLRTVAVHRKLFPQLANEKGFESEFFSSLKRVLVSSPREAAEERERALAMCKRPRRAKRIKRMVRTVSERMPEVYALERDWFDLLLQQRPAKAASQSVASNSGGGSGFDFGNLGCLWWFLAATVLRLVLRGIGD